MLFTGILLDLMVDPVLWLSCLVECFCCLLGLFLLFYLWLFFFNDDCIFGNL